MLIPFINNAFFLEKHEMNSYNIRTALNLLLSQYLFFSAVLAYALKTITNRIQFILNCQTKKDRPFYYTNSYKLGLKASATMSAFFSLALA